MAKFVVAGHSDCPYFARVELLGDRLQKNLEKFQLHKIMIQPTEWNQWLKNTCAERGWEFKKSPIVWRELIDRGGKGVLIGDAQDFEEYVKAYYDLESDMNSYDMRTIAGENKITKDELDEEDRICKAMSKPVHICVSNAANPITYHLLSTITSGSVLGSKTEVTIRLLVESPDDVEAVTGMAMEVEDLAHGLFRQVKVCTSPHEAFENCSVVVLLDELLQNEDESKLSCLKRNEAFFSKYAVIINDKALKSCKVLVSGDGPINFNAMMMIKNAPNLARQNIVAVSTILENHAKSVIGEKLSVNPAGIVDLLVWGNVNGSHYLDVKKCRVHNYNGAIWGPYWYSVDGLEMIHDNKWVAKEFSGLVEARSQKLSDALKHKTSLSSANAISTTLRYWYQGSPSGQIFSLGVYSEGWYGVPDGLVFSYPITMDPKGYWHVVQDIELTPELKQGLTDAIQDLNREIGIFNGEIDETKDEEKQDHDGTAAVPNGTPADQKDEMDEKKEEAAAETVAAAPEPEVPAEGATGVTEEPAAPTNGTVPDISEPVAEVKEETENSSPPTDETENAGETVNEMTEENAD